MWLRGRCRAVARLLRAVYVDAAVREAKNRLKITVCGFGLVVLRGGGLVAVTVNLWPRPGLGGHSKLVKMTNHTMSIWS